MQQLLLSNCSDLHQLEDGRHSRLRAAQARSITKTTFLFVFKSILCIYFYLQKCGNCVGVHLCHNSGNFRHAPVSFCTKIPQKYIRVFYIEVLNITELLITGTLFQKFGVNIESYVSNNIILRDTIRREKGINWCWQTTGSWRGSLLVMMCVLLTCIGSILQAVPVFWVVQ